MRRLGAVLMGLALVACAPRAQQQQPQQPQAIRIEDDQFSPRATIIGTRVADDQTGGEWFIRSFVDKRTGEVDHQLYVHVSYFGDRRRYDMATDDHATLLPFTRIERDRGACTYGSCDYDEDFGLGLRDAVLRERAGTGFQVKAVAHSSDSIIMTIAPGQIQPQLAAVDAYRRAHSLMESREAPPIAAPTSGRIGVALTLLPPALAPDMKLAPGVGLLVVAVGPGTAAEKTGMKPGDVILEFNGAPTNTFQHLLGPLQVIPAGTAVPIVLWRANARLEKTVQL